MVNLRHGKKAGPATVPVRNKPTWTRCIVKFRQATSDDVSCIIALYRKVTGQRHCTWNDLYPGLSEVTHDLETSNLFVLEEDVEGAQMEPSTTPPFPPPLAAQGGVIGAISIVPENELDDVTNWAVSENAREIARVVIHPACQGKGYSGYLVRKAIEVLQTQRHCASIHLAVATVNVPAYKTYLRLGFVPVGEADLFGHHFCLCEKVLA